MTRSELFWAKVDTAGICWEWTAGKSTAGYGRFATTSLQRGPGRFAQAHRYAWEQLVGPIPDGLFLDHLCRNRACVNPDHLEPVTNRVNLLRGYGVTRRNAAKTHCPRGHALVDGNLMPCRLARGQRECRTCSRDRSAERRMVGSKDGPS